MSVPMYCLGTLRIEEIKEPVGINRNFGSFSLKRYLNVLMPKCDCLSMNTALIIQRFPLGDAER